LKHHVLNRIANWLWVGIVSVVVLLAVYASFGRFLISGLGQYRESLLRELNARIDFVVQADELRGDWSFLTPHIHLGGLRILGDAQAPAGIAVDSVSVQVDVLDSLLSRSPRFFVLEGKGARLHVNVDENRRLALPGIELAPGGDLGGPLYDMLFNVERLTFEDIVIDVHEGEEVRPLHIETRLGREGEFRRLRMSVLSPRRGAWFRMIAEGAGDPKHPAEFEGVFHMRTYVTDVSDYSDWAIGLDATPLGGSLGAEVWLDVRDGAAEMAAEVSGSGLRLATSGGDGRTLELSGLDGSITAGYRQEVWRFGVAELELRRDAKKLELGGVDGEYDGNRLALRTENLRLEDVADFLWSDGSLPGLAARVLDELAPRGFLERAQLKLEDVSDLASWRFEANFSELGVDSYRGAPGVENASGYLSMDPGEGRVQLRSSDFSISFPKLYERPLNYRQVGAELAWRLDESDFSLRSGPFTAVGEEGEVRGLFALNVPLRKSEPGIEMDFMVGLSDSNPDYRRKYLPFTLNRNLLDWLESSIGDGVMKEAAFLWRGSLAGTPHRNVQLFFEVEDTAFDYHSDWPGLTDVSGLVLIDNANVDLYARRARLLDSTAGDVLVRMRKNADGQLILHVDGAADMDAGDALHVVNHSPLRNIVGDTFRDWTSEGPLRVDLRLELNLSDRAVPPRVAADTRWAGVDVEAGKLGLRMEQVTGAVSFDTATGFGATGIRGRVWGREVEADIVQGRAGDGLAELDIEVRGPVDFQSLRDWLPLPVLELAQGAAPVELHLRVPPRGGAYLQLSSALEGVALDLPPPWGKEADRPGEFYLEMELAGDERRLLANLDRQIYLGVSLDEQGFAGGSLGFSAPMPGEEKGYFLVGGTVEHADWDSWSRFLDSYVVQGGDDASPAIGGLVRVRDMRIRRLELLGRVFRELGLGAVQTPDAWELDLEMDWLRGRVRLADDIGAVDIDLDVLDMAGLDRTLEDRLGDLNPAGMSLPPVSVRIAELRNGEETWGNMRFDLEDEGLNYRFRDIRGNLRGLELGAEAGLELRWMGEGEAPYTALTGAVGFGDFGGVLERYHYDRIIESQSGAVELDLRWPGSPGDFRLAETSGGIDIAVDSGRFFSTSGTAEGTLRVVGILNLTEVVRQLSLDTSSIFQSGVQFDSITGQLLLRRHVIEVPKVDVVGRSSRFQFAGRADVTGESIDGELVATLPIASNLPWVAALVSGLPTAAAVYIVSRLFTRQMDRFSSAVYSVTGPWDSPEVEFRRIFDNTPSRGYQPRTADSPATKEAAEG